METFSEMFMPPGITGHVATRCPRCVWPYLRPVVAGDQRHLFCASCGHCWNIDDGRLRPVNVLACNGCTACAKRDCITLMQDEFPRFGVTVSE